jgi:hypothetical protein
MNSKSILEMVGGEKYINPHYNIKVEKMTKVKVTMEIEVEDIEDFSKFITTVEKGVIKFSEETKANVLKVVVKEH